MEVVRLATGYLGARGIERARLDAELLVARALGIRRLDVYLQYDRPLTEAELVVLRRLLRRRAAGEPVAYLVGVREFWGRPFRVDHGVLIPRPETETLVAVVLDWARRRDQPDGEGLRIADVGTGSGCLAVTLAAELGGATVVASDVEAAATALAAANADAHGVGDRVVTVTGSWAAPLEAYGPVDVVVSNPPYVATAELAELPREVRDYEPHRALDGGADGLDAYRALLPALPGLLRRPGLVAVEVDERRALAVADIASEVWSGAVVTVHHDLGGRDRVVALEVTS